MQREPAAQFDGHRHLVGADDLVDVGAAPGDDGGQGDRLPGLVVQPPQRAGGDGAQVEVAQCPGAECGGAGAESVEPGLLVQRQHLTGHQGLQDAVHDCLAEPELAGHPGHAELGRTVGEQEEHVDHAACGLGTGLCHRHGSILTCSVPSGERLGGSSVPLNGTTEKHSFRPRSRGGSR